MKIITGDDVWVVIEGEYSSRSVVAAFTTLEAANDYKDICEQNDPDVTFEVERLDLDPPNPMLKPLPPPVKVYYPFRNDDEIEEEDRRIRLAREKEERDAILESIDWGVEHGR